MAVQAQHPSSFFFLNSNGQEENDCLLKPQDTHFTFKKAETNSRKRSREMAELPPKPPRVIDLTELLLENNHNRKVPNAVSTGFLQSPNEHSKNQESFSFLPGDLAGEFKRQRDEMDGFIQTQGEELRRTLALSIERRYVELFCTTEELVRKKVREKEVELEKATRRHAELQTHAAQIAEEMRSWQIKAATQEAEASSLQAYLHQAISNCAMARKESSMLRGDVDESEKAEDAESVYVDPERTELIGPSCRICRRNLAKIMALPCRHLALCKGCNSRMHICPICLVIKNSSVEVFLS